ncbi:putative double-stranded RNA/RNA-DNA hybrid binding protein [Ceratocystis platani]|uniref:Putative double-stranded RNA/RNA-DNA hybrid binding protein n=1 Tax=Ceratocystis fimbriata f. sp. platani TaxID=88771 RepID=A0A0F8DEA2_CERFI|nr:putative double-stranded RNA/RNA-DNA hybrid binding protein [Ceratocystis platani]
MAKARRTINVLRRLSRVYFGIPPKSALQVMRACVVSQLTYAATTWYPMASKTALDKLEVVLRDGIRAALPVYKTTNKPSLYRDTNKLLPEGEGPPDPLAEKLSKEEAAKAHLRLLEKESQDTIWVYSDGSRDSDRNTGAGWAVYHGGKTLAQGSGACGKFREVADAEAIAALRAVRIAAEVAPPQAEGLNLCVDNLGVAKRISKRMRKPGTSQLEVDEIRRILAKWEGGTECLSLDKPVGRVHWVPGHCEVPGNEAVDQLAKAGCKSSDLLVPERTMSLAAARRWKNDAFRADFKDWMIDNCPNTDHLGGALGIPKPYKLAWMRKPGTSQLEIDEIRRILAKWEGGTESLALDKPVGRVYWVPGHCEVPGNEAVDQLAKAGCKSADLLVPERTMSLAAARRWKNDAFRADFKDWMNKVDWMKGLNRGTVARILAARSRHGDFEEYHTRLSHQDAEKRCQVPNCGKPKDFSQPWECMGNATRLAGRTGHGDFDQYYDFFKHGGLCRPATKPADTQDAAREAKSHEAASQGGEWQTVTRRKADANAPTGRYSQPAARQDNRVLVRVSADNMMRNCESVLMSASLRELDPELKKALKDVQKTKSGFALLANKDGRSTLLEKSDKIKNYIGPGTEVVQAVNTDAYLIGPIERYLNGGGRAVEVSEEIIGECFAQATRVTPVYMTSKTRGNVKTFIVKIPAAGTKVPRQLRMGSRLIPTRLLAEKPRAIAQCSRCFGWHDAKKCSRAQLCKHCGSSEHESSRHPKCCGAEHECVSVCFICRGPHPADSKQCPLRKKGTAPEERRTIRKAQQALTAEKKKACPKAGKSVQTQVVDLMECTETQAESSEMEDQSEEEGDTPVASAGDKRKAAGKARSDFSFRAPTALQGLRKSSRKKTMAATIVPISRSGHQDVMVVELAGQGLHIANVYNANPGDPERGRALKKAQETLRGKKMILCGDLNLHSQLWDSKKEDSSDCNQINDWMEQEAVALLNEPDDNTCFSNKTELFKKLPSLGYADDSLIYVSSTSVQTNIITLQTYMTHVVEWCRENELRIDWSKTGVIHLYIGRKLLSMNTGLRLPNGTTLSPVQEMKWLGVT